MAKKPSLAIRMQGWIRYRFLYSLMRTWRIHLENRELLDRMVQDGERFILCFWHGKYVPILPVMHDVGGCVFTTSCRTGDIIAQVVRNFGFCCTQITSGQGALEAMEQAIIQVDAAGIAVDGPLGPYHKVKKGAVHLASRMGCRIVPVSIDSDRKYVFKKRWDFLEVPLPFSRVCVVFGEPLGLPLSKTPGEVARHSLALGVALAALDERAADLAARVNLEAGKS